MIFSKKQISHLSTRIPYLDVLRVLACILVILVHAPAVRVNDYYTSPSAIYPFYITLITVCSKLFFVLSGALLLPTTMEPRKFISRRVKTMLYPLVVWTAIYLAARAITGTLSPRMVISLPYRPIEGALWFVYVMIIMYCTMPLVTKIIDAIGKRGLEIVLSLWVASSVIPYLHGMFIEDPQLSHHMLSGFHNVYGYLLLGYYLHNYPLPIFTRKHWWKFAIAFVVGIVGSPLFEFLVQPHFSISYTQAIATVTNDLSINTVLMAILIFSVVKHITPETYNDGKKHRIAMFFTRVSICTFGIYLSHMFVLRYFIWPLSRPYLSSLPWLADGLICAAIAFVACYVMSYILYHLPGSKYIIGR